MIDSFVLLTPILMLAVIALVRFVGCGQVWGLQHVDPWVPDPPINVQPTPRDQSVELRWEYAKNAERFEIWFHADTPTDFVVVPNLTIDVTVDAQGVQHGSATVPNLTNGTLYFFTVRAYITDVFGESEPVSAAPGVTSFVTVMTLGADRSDFTGRCGMAVRMNVDTRVTQLGRVMFANPVFGNTQPHELSIVDASQPTVVLGMVTWTPEIGKEGMFIYRPLPQPVPLQALHTYYVLTHEQSGEHFHNILGMVVSMTSGVGTIVSGVYDDETTMSGLVPYGTTNQLYGPVDFLY